MDVLLVILKREELKIRWRWLRSKQIMV